MLIARALPLLLLVLQGPAPPALTSETKKDLQLALKDVEITKLKAEAAIKDFETAKAVYLALVAKHTPPGYQLNERLDLVKLPDPAQEK